MSKAIGLQALSIAGMARSYKGENPLTARLTCTLYAHS